jgi:hypothetical protein
VNEIEALRWELIKKYGTANILRLDDAVLCLLVAVDGPGRAPRTLNELRGFYSLAWEMLQFEKEVSK